MRSLLIALSSTLLAFGFTLPTTFKLASLAVVSATIGAPLWFIHNRQSTVCVAEIIGIGSAIGFAIIGLLGLVLRGPLLVLTLSVCVTVGIALIRRYKDLVSSMTVPVRDQDLFALGATPVLAMIPFQPKVGIFVLPAVMILLIRPLRQWLLSMGNRGLALSHCTLGISAIVTYDLFRVTRPWRDLIELDLISDEATAFGLHAVGLSEGPTVIGEPIRQHFLAFAFHGTASRLFDLPRFVLVGAGGYALAICSLALLVFSYAHRQTQRRAIGWLAIVLLLLQTSVTPLTFVVPAMRGANALPMLWFAVGVIVVLRALPHPTVRDHVWLALSLAVAMLGKIHWGILLLIFLGIAVGLETFRGSKRSRLISLFATTAATSAVTYALLFDGTSDDQFDLAIRSEHLLGLAPFMLIRVLPAILANRSADGFTERASLLAIALLGLGYVLVNQTQELIRTLNVIGLIVILARSVRSPKLGVEATSTLCTAFILCAGLLTFGPAYNFGYFFNGLGVLIALVAPLTIWDSLGQELEASASRSLLLLLAGSSGFLVGVQHLLSIGEIRYGSNFDLGRIEHPALTTGLLLLAYSVLTIGGSWTRRRRSSESLSSTSTVVAIAISFGLFCALSLKPAIHYVSHSVSDFPRELLLSDQVAIGEWIDHRTERRTLLASNSLCRVDLRIGLRIPTDTPSNDCEGRNVNAWLPAISHRQTLIAAPAYGPLAFQVVRKVVHIQSYRASLEFGDSGDENALEALRDLGVSWFVVDLANSKDSSWLRTWPIAFQSGQYAVLDLARPKEVHSRSSIGILVPPQP